MLAIILGILKFIGLLFLGILGLAVAVLLLVLLVPVRYRAHGAYYGELNGRAGVSWLLHILSCQVTYEGELDMCVRVFGFRLGGNGRGTDREPGADAEPETDVGPGVDGAAAPEQVKDRESSVTGGQAKAGETQKTEETRSTESTSKSAKYSADKPGNLPKQESAQKKRWNFSFGNLFQKIRVTFQKICGKLKTLIEKREQVLDFINQADNRRTFWLLKRQFRALLKHILPVKMKGRIKFGFDDPYTTGQILTWLSPFYGLYGENLQITPVFGEKVLEGELDLRGRIRIGTLLVIALRMFTDKNFRRLLKKWREA